MTRPTLSSSSTSSLKPDNLLLDPTTETWCTLPPSRSVSPFSPSLLTQGFNKTEQDDCSSYTSSNSESDDEDEYQDCLEQLVPFPELAIEVIETIFRVGELDEQDLKSCALVCRDWFVTSRRVLFGQPLVLASHDSIKQARSQLDRIPGLALCVRNVDLSNASCRWSEQKISEVYRRASGLLRMTTQLTEISLLHVALSDKARTKFFGALLNLHHIRTASFYSSSWAGRPSPHPTSDLLDSLSISSLLTTWSSLTSLSLNCFSQHPRLLTSETCPSHSIPSYKLKELSIVSCDFDSDVSLLWLLGDSKGSLKSLTLSATTGLSSVVVEQMLLVGGSTLVELHLSIDRDDFTVPEDSDSLSASLFRNLKSLKKVTIGTDSVFGDGLWDELKGLGLERLESLTVCVPTVGFGKVESFVRGNRSEGLTELTVNTWDSSEGWTDLERWTVFKMCAEKVPQAIEMSLSGYSEEEVEEAWYGGDVSEDWGTMEALDWPTSRSTSPSMAWRT